MVLCQDLAFSLVNQYVECSNYRTSRTRVCECTVTYQITVSEKVVPPTPEEPTNNSGLPVGAVVGIVIGSALAVGIGGFALVWFVIKKKTWADFVALFKKK